MIRKTLIAATILPGLLGAAAMSATAQEIATTTEAAATPAGSAWTGLANGSNAPEAGTAERELFDAKEALRNGMTADAVDGFKRALAMDPKCAEAQFWLAGAYRKLGALTESETRLRWALALDPTLRAHLSELDQFSAPAKTRAAATAGKGAKGKG